MGEWFYDLNATNFQIDMPLDKTPKKIRDIKMGPLFEKLLIKKEENPDDSSISYTQHGVKTTYVKDESGEIKSVRYNFDKGDRTSILKEYDGETQTVTETFRENADFKTIKTVYKNNAPESKLEIFSDEHELQSRETTIKNGQPEYQLEKFKDGATIKQKESFYENGQPKYQLETFQDGEEIKQKEYFYEDGQKTMVKTLLRDGSFIIEKPQLGPDKIYIPSSDFGKADVAIYVLDEKDNTKRCVGNIFDNNYGIAPEDLNLKNLESLTPDEIKNFPKNELVSFYGEIGMFKDDTFVSFVPDLKSHSVAKNIYALSESGFPRRLLTKETYPNDNTLITNYEYMTTSNGEITDLLLYEITSDEQNNTKYIRFANDNGPFARIRTDRKGNEITEFNAGKGKWSKEFKGSIDATPYDLAPAEFREIRRLKIMMLPDGGKVHGKVKARRSVWDIVTYVPEARKTELKKDNGEIIPVYEAEYVITSDPNNPVKKKQIYLINQDGTFGELIYNAYMYLKGDKHYTVDTNLINT